MVSSRTQPTANMQSTIGRYAGARQQAGAAGKNARAKPVARRQINRWNDDVVMCSVCLAHPWSRGRISNCRDHIDKQSCECKLAKMLVATSNGVDTPMAGLWQHGDGKVTVALLTPGEGRRSKRVYWTPVTVPSDGDADAMWEQHMTIASLGVAPCRVISGVHAVNSARQHPLWCAAAEMPHTNEDGSVGAAFVTRPAVSASASIAREIEHLAAASHADLAPGEADEMSLEPSYDLVFNDFDSPPSPEVPPEEEVKLEVYDHVYDEFSFSMLDAGFIQYVSAPTEDQLPFGCDIPPPLSPSGFDFGFFPTR